MKPPPTVAEIGAEYVRQVVDLSPGQRKRYLAQVRTLASIEVPGTAGPDRPFDRTVAQVKEADVKAWLSGWDRSLKTKANYHGRCTASSGTPSSRATSQPTRAPELRRSAAA